MIIAAVVFLLLLQVAVDSEGRAWDDETLYWSDFAEYPQDVQDSFLKYLAQRYVRDWQLSAWSDLPRA